MGVARLMVIAALGALPSASVAAQTPPAPILADTNVSANTTVPAGATAPADASAAAAALQKRMHRPSPIVARPGVAVHGRKFTDAYRLFDDRDGLASGARFDHIDGLVARGGFRFRGNASDIVLRDMTLQLVAPTAAPELPAGIEVTDTVHDVLIERVVARNFQMIARPNHYTNGDGFSSEKAVTNLTFRQDKSFDNSDGGFDLKSTATKLIDTEAGGNGVNYRLWGSGEATTITSRDPHKAHIQFNAQADWTIGTLIVSSKTPAPILLIHGDVHVKIGRCVLDVPPGTKLVKIEQQFHPQLELGTGCTVKSLQQ